MEPLEIEIISWRTRVVEVGQRHIDNNELSGFQLGGIPGIFFAKDHHLLPGDRVRITITKEPTPDALPR